MVLENKEAENRYYENQDRYREEEDREKGGYRHEESVEVVEVANFREKEKVHILRSLPINLYKNLDPNWLITSHVT